MSKSIVKKDSLGLCIQAGGWTARPFNWTRFKEGDKLTTHHFSGTIFAGVGKIAGSKRGQYLERWTTCGDIGDGNVSRISIAWYKEQARQREGLASLSSDARLSDEFIRKGFVL